MKVAIYCRLSEEDKNKLSAKDDSESIQNQKSMLLQHAVSQNWEVYQIYSDDDYAGSDRNRPAFNRLLADAEKRKFDIVLCKTQSRFTRELEMVEKYIHYLFPMWGIRFVSIVDNADTDNKGNKKARQINGLINEWYLEDLSDSIKSVFDMKKAQGKHIGAFALYGYKKDPNQKGHLVVDEEAAAIVREVFTLFASGHGKVSIARLLNSRGIPNPTEYKRRKGLRYQPGKHKNSTLWRYYTISSMLTNEMYIGHMVQGKYGTVSYKAKINKPKPKSEWVRVEHTHEPIIDRALWDKVQETIGERTKPFSSTGKIGIFSRKIKCMNCGYNMRTVKNHGKHYYRCATAMTGGDCIGSFASVEKLQNIVVGELRDMNERYLDKDRLSKEITLQDRVAEQIKAIHLNVRENRQRIEECTATIRMLYTDKAKGLITDDEFIEFSKHSHNEKAILEKQIEKYHGEVERLQIKTHSSKNRNEIVQEYTDITRLEREHVETLIDYIEVGKKDPETKQLPVKIYWNF